MANVAGAAFQNGKTVFPNFDASVTSLRAGFRTTVQAHRSAWLHHLEARLNELTSLPRGWDGYHGQPVSFTSAQFAANLIERLYVEGVPAPQIVPGSDGTLQIEWHHNQLDIEIDVLGAYDVIATRTDLTTGEDVEIELDSDFSALSDWVNDLRQPVLEAA